ncbi:MAG: hypothetical protein WCP21_21620, partial [Armatimonadota bacterium]
QTMLVQERSGRYREALPPAFPVAPAHDRGVAIIGVPQTPERLLALRRQGWFVVYDLSDDWATLAEMGDAPWYESRAEKLLIECADLLTSVSGSLGERPASLGCDRTPIVIPNAAAGPWGATPVPPDMVLRERGTAVYVGSLYGQRFDWLLLEQTARDLPDVAFNLVGDFENVPQGDNLHFVGPKTHPAAMEYVTNADVGIIPFRHERLCGAADPIKWYDYVSGGCAVASAAHLSGLRGRPWTFFADPGADTLRGAIEQALRQGRHSAEEAGEYLAGHSWGTRARSLATAVDSAIAKRRQTRRIVKSRLVERSNLRADECRLRATWAGPSTCNMTPPCRYCSVAWSRALRPSAHARSDQVVLQALLRLAAEHGPLYLSVCYGEPLVDDQAAALIGTIARYAKIDLVSNLIFPLERLGHIPRNGNVAFCASFHPHYWKNVSDFISKRQAVAQQGFVVGITEVVAYPPVLGELPQWLQELRSAGVPCGVLPYAGLYRGRQYPEAYTEEEWSSVLGGLAGFYSQDHQDLARRQSPAGCLCECGYKYVWIDWDGTVRRCVAPDVPT